MLGRTMARSRKRLDYLDALLDPHLPGDRRLALELMAMARQVPAPPTALHPVRDIVAEVTRQKSMLRCLSCGINIGGATIFCSQFCEQKAKVVRYVRRALVNASIEEPAVQMAVGVRLWMLAGGGYPSKTRSLSAELQDRILERDGCICQVCGKTADQVGRLDGGSSAIGNLRALCCDCNRRESFNHIHPATAEQRNRLKAMLADLAQRISAPVPALLCDDHEHWKKYEPGIRIARRGLVQQCEVRDAVFYPHAVMMN
ncbi:MAG TPA: hypothetical protein VHU42_19490 [Rhodopila sp.]|nr:hypothetical protein [Rhodopila sp.]